MLSISILSIVIASTLVIVHERSAQAATKPSLGAIVSAPLPVVRCPTRVGADIGHHVVMPKALNEPIARDLASKTAVFVDQYDAMRMVGPRNWSCVASIAADGGASLSIYPRGTKSPGFFKSFIGRSLATEITVQREPACYGCRLSLACAFFAVARQLFQKAFPGPGVLTSCSRPRGETITGTTKFLRYFSDQPGVAGHAYPSGGPYLALGVAYFNPKTSSYLVSCTLPTASHTLCDGALDWFVYHHQVI
jgi:hypothetical protein